MGYYFAVHPSNAPSSEAVSWSSEEWYNDVNAEAVDVEAVGEKSFWGAVQVRTALTLKPAEFKRKYMHAGVPVVIRDDPGAMALAHGLTLDKILSMCGDLSPELGNRIVSVLQNLPPPIFDAVSERLWATDGLSLESVITELKGEGNTKTLNDFFNGPLFSAVQTAQDPRFPSAKKDWTHPADYLWPPSIHSWRIAQCKPLKKFVADILDRGASGTGGISYLRALIEDDGPDLTAEPKEIYDTFLFASGDKCRAYHPHIHGRPNHTILLVLKGSKRVVTWPASERDKLYPFMSGQLGRNDIGERNEIFMVDAFNVNTTLQPDLKDVSGGLMGQARKGDLLYIPCGLVHTLENVGDMVAIGWLPTDETDKGITKPRLKHCPNANAYKYVDGDHS